MRHVLVVLEPVRVSLIRVVRHVHRKVDEERIGLVVFDELAGLVHHQVGEKFPICVDLLTIAIQVVAVRPLPVEEVRVVVDAATHVTEGMIKALCIRHVLWRVA